MPFEKSPNVDTLKPSATLAVAARARELKAQGHDIIDLSAGEPDFATPGFIADAGVEAIHAGQTRYTAAAGMPQLRQAIAADLSRSTGRATDPAGVVVSAGAKQALFNAIFSVFGPGDRVVVPVPYWTSYPALVDLARAEPVFVAGSDENDFKLTRSELDALDDVAGIIVNSPANPSGAVYSESELLSVAEWARDRGAWIISDQIYGRLCHTAPRAPGLLDLPEWAMERGVVVDGASKLFAMTGWRIGFSYTAVDQAATMAAVQSHMTSNPATPSQYAALAAFEQDPLAREEITDMTRRFAERRDLVLELMERLLPGADYVRPDGAFYLFFRPDDYFAPGSGSVELCTRLLDEAGVALVPGAAFGDDRYVRMSYAASEESIREGLRRVADVLAGSASG